MTDSRRSFLLWGALGAAFSPVIVNLVRESVIDSIFYPLLAGLLLGVLLWRIPLAEGYRRPMAGRSLVVMGLMVETVGIASGSWSVARFGLPISVIGVALIIGQPRPAVAALAFGLVPIPTFVYGISSPEFESLLGATAGGVLAATGWPVEVGGPLLQYRGARFELLSFDSGLLTAFLCAEVGWYSAMRRGGSVRCAGLRAVAGTALGLLFHPVLLLVCVATLPLGWPTLGRFVLTHGPWLTLAAGVLLYEASSGNIGQEGDRPGVRTAC